MIKAINFALSESDDDFCKRFDSLDDAVRELFEYCIAGP